MSVYLVNGKGKGWRYDFTHEGIRHTEAWFTTKKAAKEAEARKRQELTNPPPVVEMKPEKTETIPTDMAFLELVNHRLDYVKAYKCGSYYREHVFLARRLMKIWKGMNCGEITTRMVQAFLIKRGHDSALAANRDLRYLRATFNFGIKQGLIKTNPTQGLEFIPVERKLKYVPPKEDVTKMLLAADPEAQDYLVAIMNTMARVGEINRLTWEDVNFDQRWVVLYTRKKKGGHLTPRKVPMTTRLYEMLLRRHKNRDKGKPWVFWSRLWSHKAKAFVERPYEYRNKLMAILCKRAGVRHFGFHALRHFGASVLDRANVPIGSIQRILGHENRTTTEIYLHSVGEGEREAMEVFEKACLPDLPEKVSHRVSHSSPRGKKRG
jgi:integrase